MKHRLFYTLGLIVLGVVAFATSPAKAQTTAPGPYYATPSWDQTLACTTIATCPRFIVLSNMSSAAVVCVFGFSKRGHNIPEKHLIP
jgi:hypothetical protein